MQDSKVSKLICSSCGRQNCADMHSWGPGFRTEYIIHYIIHGSGYYICEGKTHYITAGQSFLIRPFTEVHYYPDENDPWEYTWIEFSGEGFLLLLDKIKFCDGGCVIDYIKPELILPLYDYLCSIWYHTSRALFDYTSKNIALAILSVYSELFPISGQRMCESIYFDSARAIIRSSYHKAEFGIESICRELNISRVTLHRSFIKSCGVSPGAYLAEYRIERAKELLKRGVAVKATALSCGFADPLYFSKAFCKAEGISPREFRRRFEIK